MTGKQEAVIWIGLLLIVLNLVAQWSQVKAVLFGGGTGSAGNGSPGGGIPGGPNPLQYVLPFILPINTQQPPVQKTPTTVSA